MKLRTQITDFWKKTIQNCHYYCKYCNLYHLSKHWRPPCQPPASPQGDASPRLGTPGLGHQNLPFLRLNQIWQVNVSASGLVQIGLELLDVVLQVFKFRWRLLSLQQPQRGYWRIRGLGGGRLDRLELRGEVLHHQLKLQIWNRS